MKWKFDPRTGGMVQDRPSGIEVTARMGGIMVEDHDRNVQFMVNYGNSRITHCVGCRPENLHLFNDNDARKIAERMRRIGSGKGIDEIFYDYRIYSINKKDFNMRNENHHVQKLNEFNSVDKESLENLYLGKTIRIINLQGEGDRYAGKTGKVTHIDDIGQLHGDWGGLAVIPDVDSFEIV